ncbi:MAG: DNA replication/repair protein RecF [Polyangia bacterium]
MRVIALEAVDFRNLAQVVVEPHPRFNVLHGDNGQGKTNLLEAVYLLGTLRSFRAAKTEELIRFGQARARVRARVSRLGTERLLEVELSPGHKSARLDGKHARSSQYFGGFNVVLFAPEDLRLPRGAPSGRRRFLDRAIFNAQPGYLAEAQSYERVLRSRNALLRSGAFDPALLEVYETQLAEAAVPLVTRRHRFVEALAPKVAETFSRVTGGLSLEIAYESTLDVPEERIAGLLRERLLAERRRDAARGATSSGPHTDDLALRFEGRAAGAYASQGQLRAIVLALKIAEIEQLTSALGDAPVLLLDDVSSELDATRNAQLFEFLREVPSQAFITTTHPAHVLLTKDRQDYQVVSGTISIEKGDPAC